MLLEGRVAIVTGAGRGIGLATAELLAREGASITIAERNPEGSAAAAEAIRSAGGDAISVPTDVARAEQVEAMVDATVRSFGGLDILVNNAGLEIQQPLLETTEEQWSAVVDTNLKGSFLCARAAVPHMVKRGGGAIVNVASVLALRSQKDFGPYCASKAGLLGLTRSMVLEWAPLGVRTNCVLPGATDTVLMWQWTPPEELEAARQQTAGRVPAGHVGAPEEIAQAILWFCTPAASFAAGSMLVIDGGSSSGSR